MTFFVPLLGALMGNISIGFGYATRTRANECLRNIHFVLFLSYNVSVIFYFIVKHLILNFLLYRDLYVFLLAVFLLTACFRQFCIVFPQIDCYINQSNEGKAVTESNSN